MNTSYIRPLDGLRAVAVSLVILFHFSKIEFITYHFEIGWIGVQMFFVLSGFLITRILLNEKSKAFGDYSKKFYWRRFLRIFPIYYAYIIAITAGYILFKAPPEFPDIAPYLYTYTYNYSVFTSDWTVNRLFLHLWSLAVEEQFYLIWPFVVYFVSHRTLKVITVAIILIVPFFRYGLSVFLLASGYDVDIAELGVYWFTLSHFDAFAIGGALSIFQTSVQKLNPTTTLAATFALCVLGGVLNLLFYPEPVDANLVSSLGYPIESFKNEQHIWSYTILNLLFAALIHYCAQLKSGLLSSKFMVEIGKVSYGMYLFHFPIIMVFDKIAKKPVFNDAISFAICYVFIFVAAWVSFHLYEKRFLRLKDRFFR